MHIKCTAIFQAAEDKGLTVEKFIERLQECPPNAQVYLDADILIEWNETRVAHPAYEKDTKGQAEDLPWKPCSQMQDHKDHVYFAKTEGYVLCPGRGSNITPPVDLPPGVTWPL